MPYFTTCYLNNVTMTLSAAWEIPNLFPQSEPVQISSISLSCPTVWKTSHNHCIFSVTGVLWFCIVCSCFNVLTSHVQSSIELLYPINHYCCIVIVSCEWLAWSERWHVNSHDALTIFTLVGHHGYYLSSRQQSQGFGFHRSVSVCLSTWYLKTRCSKAIKLDKEMFRDEFWTSIVLGVKRSKSQVNQCESLHSVSAGSFF